MHSIDEGRLLQAAARHRDLVTCVTATTDGRTLVSGVRLLLQLLGLSWRLLVCMHAQTSCRTRFIRSYLCESAVSAESFEERR